MTENTPSTTTDTSATSAPATSSAPAESRPSTVEASLDASFAAMLAGGEPATPHPAQAAPEATTPAPATTEPPPVEAQTAAEPVGPIPLDRHKAALENARTKAREEASQQFQQEYGNQLRVVQALAQDLPGTLGQLLDEALTSEQFGPAVKAMLGRKLQGMRQRAQAPVEDQEPSYFVEQNGERYFDPAAFARWQQWNTQKLSREMEQKFAPLSQFQSQLEQAQQVAQLQEQSRQTVTERLKFWQEQPGFTDHKKAIAAKQKELVEAHGLDTWTALGLAYAQVVPPLLQAKSTNDFIVQANQKSRASTANPVASAPAQPRKFRTPEEAINAAFEGVTTR